MGHILILLAALAVTLFAIMVTTETFRILLLLVKHTNVDEQSVAIAIGKQYLMKKWLTGRWLMSGLWTIAIFLWYLTCIS